MQARADDAARQEARSIYEHGERSSQAKNAVKRAEEAEARKLKQETQFHQADLTIKQANYDLNALQVGIEGAKLGMSDAAQEQNYMQAQNILNNPRSSAEQKAQAKTFIDGYAAMKKSQSAYSALYPEKQAASEFSNAQDNYRTLEMEHLKNNPDTPFMSFADYLKQHYTPSQIQAMTNGQQIGTTGPTTTGGIQNVGGRMTYVRGG